MKLARSEKRKRNRTPHYFLADHFFIAPFVLIRFGLDRTIN